MRHTDGLDLIEMVIKAGDGIKFAKKWNSFLSLCVKSGDVQKLLDVRRRMQIGMSDISDRGMNIPKVCKLFLRCQFSIEKEVRRMIKKRNPGTTDLAIDKILKDASF